MSHDVGAVDKIHIDSAVAELSSKKEALEFVVRELEQRKEDLDRTLVTTQTTAHHLRQQNVSFEEQHALLLQTEKTIRMLGMLLSWLC